MRRLCRAMAVGLALWAFAGPVWAGTVGVAVRASTLAVPGPSTPAPLVIFPDGASVDLMPLHDWIAARVLAGDPGLLLEPVSGAVIEMSEDFEAVGVVSFEGGSSVTLGQILDEPGAVVRFVSASAASADPTQAERFDVAYANGTSAAYVAGPVFQLQAPEPGLGAGLVAGCLLLTRLQRRRRATGLTNDPS